MNFDHINTYIGEISLHMVGSSESAQQIKVSQSSIELSKEMNALLTHHFISSIKHQNLYTFFHEEDMELNKVFAIASKIFRKDNRFHEHSIALAKHLFDQSNDSNINDGEFFIVNFSECTIEGQSVDAIGLFKTENKDSYLQIGVGESNYSIQEQRGIKIGKLDKGAIIYNRDRDQGYVLAVVDNTTRSDKVSRWVEDFLQIKPRIDSYYQTSELLKSTKDFVVAAVKEGILSKMDQATIFSSAIEYFQENDTYQVDDFNATVFADEKTIRGFEDYKSQATDEINPTHNDRFEISPDAVKKCKRSINSIIKLDSNFRITISRADAQIIKGDDSNGKFYKLYYSEEL